MFTFCDRDLVTNYDSVVSQILSIMYRPNGDRGVTRKLSPRSFLDGVRRQMGWLCGGTSGSARFRFGSLGGDINLSSIRVVS